MLFPIVIAVVLAIVQGALWAHAGAIAQAAADHGVEVAASLGSTDSAGIAAAEDFVANAGMIRDVRVTATNLDNSAFVEMTVSGSFPSVFGMWSVSATALTVREQVPQP